MVVDFFPSEREGTVLALGVRKEALSSHLSSLSDIQMAPQLVTLEDVALFSLFVRISGGPGDEPVAILHGSGARKVVQVVRKGKLDFIRVLPGSRELGAQLQESLGLYAMKNREPVKEILITGRSALEEASPEQVTGKTGIPASVWRPFDQIRHGFGEVAPEIQARMSVPLGLALSAADGQRKFNLRREEFVLKESFNLKSLLVYMLCALVLFFGLFTFQLQRKVSIREASYNALNVKIRQIFDETFPGTANVVRGKEAAQMAQRISADTTQYQWLEEMTGQGSVLETLLVITQKLAGFGDVQVDNLSMEAGKISLDGRTSSFKTVDDLKARLGEPGLFKSAKLVSAKMDSREQAVLFNFVLEKTK
jgi:Tfp pilus assembly protein PilN